MFNQRGFSFISFIIFIAIVGIFLYAIWPSINPLERYYQSQDNQRKADLQRIQQALEKYYQDRGRYPSSSPTTNSSSYRIVVPQSIFPIEWGKGWVPYLIDVPKDPNNLKKYVYYSPPASGGQTYYLYASLDLGDKDEQACNHGMACQSLQLNSIDEKQCGGICNYALTSNNVSP